VNEIALTYWPGKVEGGRVVVPAVKHPVGQRVRTTWPALLGRLSVSRVVEEKDRAPGLSLATFRDDRRALANVEKVYAVGLDLDHFDCLPIRMTRRPGQIIPAPTWEDVIARFERVDSFVHTTWSSTEETPRVRVFLRLDRGVTAAEYRRVYSYCADLVEGYGFLVDRAASDPSRFWFLPSVPPHGRYRYSVGRGRVIRADVALATVPETATTPSPAPRPPATTTPDIEERAARYLERCEPAIAGQEGHKTTFLVCQKIVRGFGLDAETAFRLLTRWNATCSPPWSERDLRRKVREAEQRGTMAWGELRDRERAS
jgi:hypothetical protein